MQLVWAERSYPITGGILVSLVFHVLLALLIVLGVPSFFKPEVLEVPPTIELATLADITAAPKVDKAGKPMDKPKPQAPAPETKKPEPPKPAPPKLVTPPPPAAEQQAAVIPDKPIEKEPEQKKPEPKPEEKKQPEKKKAEEKPKPDKAKQEFDALLKNLAQETPAPETEEKLKKNATPAPAEPTTGQVTDLVNDVPLTMAEQDGIRSAIEERWNIPLGMANITSYVVMLRLHLTQDGIVTGIDVLDSSNDPGFRTVADSARRAILLTQNELGRLPIPPDKYNATMVVRWNMKLICDQRPGGC